jgi:hypothetical protein
MDESAVKHCFGDILLAAEDFLLQVLLVYSSPKRMISCE